MRWTRERLLVAVSVAAATVLIPVLSSPAAQAAPATQPAQRAPVVRAGLVASGGWMEQQPSQAEIGAQQAQLQKLAQQEHDRAGVVRGTRASLQSAAQDAGLALEVYTVAVRRLNELQVAERQQQDRLATAQQAVDRDRGELGRWARAAYQGGGGALGTHATLTALLEVRSGEDVATSLTVLRRIGQGRNHAVDTVQSAQQQQSMAAQSAAGASQQAAAAAIQAASARRAADTALSLQRTALGRAQGALDRTRSALGRAQRRRIALEAASALGAGVPATSGQDGNRVTGTVGSCTGGADVQQYPNGQIPLGALCPLWAAPQHHLRADAAFAFDRLSRAYVQRFGTPICITDSYRSLAAQISVYQRKPGLAAVPGTSNHGWGTATDLCGGIQQFGSAQHHWMQLNAPLYGWFHPAWAQPDGSRPEPWHWEFAG